MTTEEAARFLFVSRPHIHHLLEIGQLVAVMPRNVSGEVDIDTASIRAYKAKNQAAARAYFDSQTEDKDPSGL
ncbi:MAG: hypothetical protein WCA85_15530 [Paraburkholderia sp.]|uniref:hypothetical protein n=1 Tax=Paraburkholderia sp. TaxID=1926495 RepID=UPI003C405ABF